MNYTIGQILYIQLLDKDQEHWSNYVAVTAMNINSTINASIQKVLVEVLYSENIPLPVDLLLSRESSINPQALKSANKLKQFVDKIKNAMYNA